MSARTRGAINGIATAKVRRQVGWPGATGVAQSAGQRRCLEQSRWSAADQYRGRSWTKILLKESRQDCKNKEPYRSHRLDIHMYRERRCCCCCCCCCCCRVYATIPTVESVPGWWWIPWPATRRMSEDQRKLSIAHLVLFLSHRTALHSLSIASDAGESAGGCAWKGERPTFSLVYSIKLLYCVSAAKSVGGSLRGDRKGKAGSGARSILF